MNKEPGFFADSFNFEFSLLIVVLFYFNLLSQAILLALHHRA
jgi:hypothetical protein